MGWFKKSEKSESGGETGILKGNPARVLIVDDDPAIVVLLERILTSIDSNFTVDSVETGEQAKIKIQKGLHSEDSRYELALIDIKLPGQRSGFDVLREFKLISPNTKFVIISSTPLSDFKDVYGGEETAANYIQKPFDKDRIETHLKKLFI